MEEQQLFCLCRKPFDEANPTFMIECSRCSEWMHGECVFIDEADSAGIDTYICPQCSPPRGATTSKAVPPAHPAINFFGQLKQRTFLDAASCVRIIQPAQLTEAYVLDNGFTQPLYFSTTPGLGIGIPANLSIQGVLPLLGLPSVQVLDSGTQTVGSMTVQDWINSPKASEFHNLDLTLTPLRQYFTPPTFVQRLDFALNCWPQSGSSFSTPTHSLMLLMSRTSAFRDFHIEAGGTSVWHYVFQGTRVYYLIEPTNSNLELYESWRDNPDHDTIFLSDTVTECYQQRVSAGSTIFIPAGWIFAYYNEADVLGVGGRFLILPLLEMSLRIAAMEERLCIRPTDLFTSFSPLLWYAARSIGNNQLPMETNPTCQTNIAALLKCLRNYVKHPLHCLGIPADLQSVNVLSALQALLPEHMIALLRQQAEEEAKAKPAALPPKKRALPKAAPKAPSDDGDDFDPDDDEDDYEPPSKKRKAKEESDYEDEEEEEDDDDDDDSDTERKDRTWRPGAAASSRSSSTKRRSAPAPRAAPPPQQHHHMQQQQHMQLQQRQQMQLMQQQQLAQQQFQQYQYQQYQQMQQRMAPGHMSMSMPIPMQGGGMAMPPQLKQQQQQAPGQQQASVQARLLDKLNKAGRNGM